MTHMPTPRELSESEPRNLVEYTCILCISALIQRMRVIFGVRHHLHRATGYIVHDLG